jgi:peptidoglycan/LPS O-acetylase OafA/YrhL
MVTEGSSVTPNVWTGSGRLLSIDALRAVAALSVVVFHASDDNARHAALWAGSWVDAVSVWGRFGVWLFFVISGFCIHLRWARAYRPGYVPDVDFLAFWKRRFVRLYPPYACAVALFLICLAVEGRLPTLRQFGLHVVLLNNLDLDPATVDSINGVFWTLAIEEQLYLAYFLLLKLRVRYGWPITLACCVATRVLWFALAGVLHRAFQLDIVITYSPAAQWIVWALGALAVEVALGIATLPPLLQRGWVGTAIIATAILTTAGYGASASSVVRNGLWCVSDVLWGLGFFVWVNRAAVAERSWNARGKAPAWIAPLAACGVFSYSIYLTHDIVIQHLWNWVRPEHPGGIGMLMLEVVAVTAASLLFARVLFQWFERPFLVRARGTIVALSPMPAIR